MLRRGFSSPGFDQGKPSEFDQFIENVMRDVAELPDRTSPDDQPEMMLVSGDELKRILATRLMEALPPPLMASPRPRRVRFALWRTI